MGPWSLIPLHCFVNSITLFYWKILEQLSEKKIKPKVGRDGAGGGGVVGVVFNSFSLITTEKPSIKASCSKIAVYFTKNGTFMSPVG